MATRSSSSYSSSFRLLSDFERAAAARSRTIPSSLLCRARGVVFEFIGLLLLFAGSNLFTFTFNITSRPAWRVSPATLREMAGTHTHTLHGTGWGIRGLKSIGCVVLPVVIDYNPKPPNPPCTPRRVGVSAGPLIKNIPHTVMLTHRHIWLGTIEACTVTYYLNGYCIIKKNVKHTFREGKTVKKVTVLFHFLNVQINKRDSYQYKTQL